MARPSVRPDPMCVCVSEDVDDDDENQPTNQLTKTHIFPHIHRNVHFIFRLFFILFSFFVKITNAMLQQNQRRTAHSLLIETDLGSSARDETYAHQHTHA